MTSAQWLKQLYEQRHRQNPGLSLRAFADYVGLSHSLLSQIMTGRRRLTEKVAFKICRQLGMEKKNILAIITDVAETNPTPRTAPHNVLEVDDFSLIAHWHYYATLCLAEFPHVRLTPEVVSERLALSLDEARGIVTRLCQLRHLAADADGHLRPTTDTMDTQPDVPQPAVRDFHTQVLQLGQQSLHKHAVRERYFGSEVMAIDPSLLPRAKQLMRQFRKDMTDLMGSQEKSRVYCFALQMFPLDVAPAHGEGAGKRDKVPQKVRTKKAALPNKNGVTKGLS